MKKEILPVLLDVLKTDNILAIREVIDAIGFMRFYQKLHSSHQIIDAPLLYLKTNFKDEVTRWKLVRAFESFNDINVIHTLLDIEKNDDQPIIRNEAKRSLGIINSRTGN